MKKNLSLGIAFAFSAALFCFALSGCSEDAHKEIPADTSERIQQIDAGNYRYDELSYALTVSDASTSELMQHLSDLPQLSTLILEGSVPPAEDLIALKAEFPDLSIVCPVCIGGMTVATDIAHLDFSDTSVDFSTLSTLLPLFHNLQELTTTGTGLTVEENMLLADGLPGVLVRCELPLAGQTFTTDRTEIDLSNCPATVDDVERMLPYFPRLQKLDMSFCGISDEDMDALKQRHPETEIVWTVTIGEVKTRTDAIYFYPAEFNYYPTNAEMTKLRYCTELIAIDIGHTRATDCEFLWYTPKVRYLILADTGITDITPVGNLKELIYLELFNLKITDYAPLLSCTKLQDLNIGTTHADPEPLSKMTWLHNLQWHRADQDPATKEAVLKLPEQLPDTNVELYPKKKARNIGGGWRYIPNYYVFRDIIGADYFNQDQIRDYWGPEDGDRIIACNGGKSFSAYTLAEIVRERIDQGEPIVGLKHVDSEKAEILYQTLMNAESWIKEG